MVLVTKKDGSFRFCVDYRKLNSVTKPISWPLPLLSDVLDAMSENQPKWFSVVDAKSGYFQVPLHPDSIEKSAFCTHEGSFEFLCMSFGLMNAPHTYQMLMSQVFRGMMWKSVACYIDDVMIFSKDFDTHLKHIQEVFDRLREANIRLHPTKCKFALKKVVFLGHVLTPEGVAVDESKIDMVKNWPRPKSVKDVRSFLGFCNYYRRFVKGFAEIASPLNNLLKKENEFNWTEECQKAFERLRTAMSSTPVLGFPRMDRPFSLCTDASMSVIGYVLSQVGEDGLDHPISFGGRSLRANEKNWSVTHIEGLALCEGIREFYSFLCNQPFTVYVDHISLSWLQSIKNTHGRLYRWALLLQPLKFTICYKKGKLHTNADGLSRREYPPAPDEDPDDEVVNDVIEFAPLKVGQQTTQDFVKEEPDVQGEVTIEEDSGIGSAEEGSSEDGEEKMMTIAYFKYDKSKKSDPVKQDVKLSEGIMAIDNVAQLQRQCPDLSRIIQFLENGELPQDAKLARQTVYEADEYFFKGDILYHHFSPGGKHLSKAIPVIEQMAIPSSLRIKVLQQFHDQLGHSGHDKTYMTIKSKYYWPNLYRHVRQYVKTCLECQQSKFDSHFKKAPLVPWAVAPCCSRWHIDFLGELPTTPEGYKYILLCVDSFSRWPEAYPMKSQNAEDVADTLYNQVFCRYGCPEVLLSDRGGSFVAAVVTKLCQLFDVKKVKTSSFRPQCNSTAENFNRHIWKCLRCYCDKQENWNQYLQSILLGYRASTCVYSTQFSPYQIMFGGRDIRLPIDNELKPTAPEKRKSVDAYVQKLMSKIKVVNEVAKQNVEDNQKVYKEKYDQSAKPSDYKPGTLVWLFSPQVKPGTSKKMHIKYSGPYYIVAKTSECNYLINDCKTHKQVGHAVHSDRLKLCNMDRDLFMAEVMNADRDMMVSDREDKVMAEEELVTSEEPLHDLQCPGLEEKDKSQRMMK